MPIGYWYGNDEQQTRLKARLFFHELPAYQEINGGVHRSICRAMYFSELESPFT
jgi:hypothetical protein